MAKTWSIEKKIAFRQVDSEGDIWCENVFLFDSIEDVPKFFTADNPALLDIFTEPENRVINDIKVDFFEEELGTICCIEFNTEYAGDVLIKEMKDGWICKLGVKP